MKLRCRLCDPAGTGYEPDPCEWCAETTSRLRTDLMSSEAGRGAVIEVLDHAGLLVVPPHTLRAVLDAMVPGTLEEARAKVEAIFRQHEDLMDEMRAKRKGD